MKKYNNTNWKSERLKLFLKIVVDDQNNFAYKGTIKSGTEKTPKLNCNNNSNKKI